MKILPLSCTILALLFLSCSTPQSLPDQILGNFEDDYGIRYEITNHAFTMQPNSIYHIVEINNDQQFLIAQNDANNKYDPELYTRIDWVNFEDMEPFQWGFCISAYNASSPDSIKSVKNINREAPKTGCNGYPFSRMKPIQS